MSKLTVKQQKFVDEYIISGNATDAYKKAGYSGNDRTAGVESHKLLKKPKIAEAIAERSKEAKNERLMDVEEALALSASIARGEVQKSYSKQYDRLEKRIVKEIDYEFAPSIEERQKSLEHILKVNGAFIDRKEITGNSTVTFVDDIGSDLVDD